MNINNIILHGNIIFSTSPEEMERHPDSYIVVKKGMVEGIYKEPPRNTEGLAVIDYGDNLIIPGFSDLHIHAPQFCQRGIGMNLELLQWLENHTFHQEARFSDLQYAERIYTDFVDELARQGTLHSSIFATIHKEATELLFEILSRKGLKAYVGKVNMDRNSPPVLTENTEISVRESEDLIIKYMYHPLVRPILSPRFVPVCSKRLLHMLGDLAWQYNAPVQSHLGETMEEVKWVKKLHPEAKSYADIYNQNNLFGQTAALMAHCIYLSDREIELMKKNGVIAVHCPESNLNLSSGIMQVRKLINKGVTVGLGSDVGGGHNLSMVKAMVRAIQSSKVIALTDRGMKPLAFEEAFYMATKGNGSFFGKVGSFEAGYDFDAIIIDDSSLEKKEYNLAQRLQRFVYIGDDRNIIARFVNGILIR